jgi:peroxiredoxin
VYNIDRLRQQAEMFNNAGVVTLCVFRSTSQNIAKYSTATRTEGVIALSDKQGSVFKKFMIKKSTRAAIQGTIEMLKSYKKYKQVIDVSAALKDTRGGTNMAQIRQLPADFMIDEDGVIVDLFRAENMMDHMPFERVEAFIPDEKRCRCHKKDCIVSILYIMICWRRYSSFTSFIFS